jgi:membrane fusion protein (multidrug efflux system)
MKEDSEKRNLKTRLLVAVWAAFPWLLVCLILVFLVTMGRQIVREQSRLAEAKKEAAHKIVPAVSVVTLILEPKRLEDRITLPAEVEPFEELWVKAEVKGQVTDVMAEEGRLVRMNQELVQLDQRDYRAHLDRIEANHRLAVLDHERMEALVKKKIAAENKLDEAVARLKELGAQRQEAELALNRTRITAPIQGLVNEIKAKKGDLLEPGQPVAQILQIDKVKVTVGIPESDVAAICDLLEADVVIEALGKRKARGRKCFLSSKPRSLARLYDLELTVPNPDGDILPGMFARVELVKEVFQKTLVIPLYAVIVQGDESVVYVEEGGRARKRKVEIGVLSDWQVQVVSGLAPGEKVIVVGHRLLDEGQEVNVIKVVRDPGKILDS